MIIDRLSPDMIIEELINREMFLPLIQRGFRWDEERIEKFFDSLIKHVPVGLVLVYRHDGSFKLMGRKFFEGFGESTESEQYKYELAVDNGQLLVLDGQQRLQALYIGLKGTYYGQTLYHNVFLNFEKPHEISFNFKKSDDAFYTENGELYVKVPLLYKITKDYIKKRSHARPENLQIFRTIIADNSMTLEEKETERFFDYIENAFLPAFFVPEYFQRIVRFQLVEANDVVGKNKLKNLLEIFVRFNTGGLRLEKSDLMFSILKAHGWQDVEYRINSLAELTDTPKDLLVKALIVVNNLSARTDIYDTADYITELKKIYDHFEETVKNFYDRLLQITQVPERVLRKFNFLIPIIYYLSKVEVNGLLPKDVIEYILIIVYNSNLRSDSYIDELVKIIRDEIEKGNASFPMPKIKETLEKRRVGTEINDNSLNRDPILTFSLIQRSNWSPLVINNKLSIDHVFPKAKASEIPIKDTLGTWTYLDSIWNKYIVFLGDNIRKSDTWPEDYFTGEKEKFLGPYILPKDKSLLKKEKFLSLLEWRRKVIIDSFEKTLAITITPILELEEKSTV